MATKLGILLVGVALVRERGLKCQYVASSWHWLRRSRKGAWIEIVVRERSLPNRSVD